MRVPHGQGWLLDFVLASRFTFLHGPKLNCSGRSGWLRYDETTRMRRFCLASVLFFSFLRNTFFEPA